MNWNSKAKFIVNSTCPRVTVAFKRMASYCIQTNQGLYHLKKCDTEVTKCPEVSGRNIDILIPPDKETTFNKLGSLKALEQACLTHGISYLKTFCLSSGRSFKIAFCINDENSNALGKLDTNEFDRSTFEWNGNRHILTHCSNKDDIGSEYGLYTFDSHHPIVDSDEYRPVYSTYQQVLPALQNLSPFDKEGRLLSCVENMDKDSLYKEKPLKHPFIVVEGLDGTGKSTCSANLAKYLEGVRMATPPPLIADIRKQIDHLPEKYRRSFYAFGNYLAVQDVLGHSEVRPVVMDRFWHSTTSYAIAAEIPCGITQYLPPKGHGIFTWPKDLLQPSAVVFLTTKEKDRDKRVNKREGLVTKEEKEISADEAFRVRIMETYRRIGHPNWIEVDTSGTPEETLAKVVSALKCNGVIL